MQLVRLKPLGGTEMMVNPENITYVISYSAPGDGDPNTTIHFAGTKDNYTMVKGTVSDVLRQLGV